MQQKRKKLHDAYVKTFSKLKAKGLKMLYIPDEIETNYHAFWLLFQNEKQRDVFLKLSLEKAISPYIGYIPLHTSPMGLKLGGGSFNLPITDFVGSSIVRLPFYIMDHEEIEYTCKNLLISAEVALSF